jgi:hypothetical protein
LIGGKMFNVETEFVDVDISTKKKEIENFTTNSRKTERIENEEEVLYNDSDEITFSSLVRFIGVLLTILVIIITFRISLFSWHPILMTFSFCYLFVEAILIMR